MDSADRRAAAPALAPSPQGSGRSGGRGVPEGRSSERQVRFAGERVGVMLEQWWQEEPAELRRALPLLHLRHRWESLFQLGIVCIDRHNRLVIT